MDWILTESNVGCSDSIAQGTRENLRECEILCGRHYAIGLTFYSNNYCRCCAESSEVKPSTTGNVSTFKGNTYIPIF